jgi:HTH-type transcriptional regulator / antitoxin HigA
MASDLKPIRSEADYARALAEVRSLWGAKDKTPAGDRLDILASLIDAYEAQQYPTDPPDPVAAIKTRTRVAKAAGHNRSAKELKGRV